MKIHIIALLALATTALTATAAPEISLRASARYNGAVSAEEMTAGNYPSTFTVRAGNTSTSSGTLVTTGFVLEIKDGSAPVVGTISISSLTRTQKWDQNGFDGNAGEQVMLTGNGTPMQNFAFGAYGPVGGALPDIGAYSNTTLTSGTSAITTTVSGDRVVLSNHQIVSNGDAATTNGGRPWLTNPGNSISVEYRLQGTASVSGGSPMAFDLRQTARVIVVSNGPMGDFRIQRNSGTGNYDIYLVVSGLSEGESSFWPLEQSTDLAVWIEANTNSVSYSAGEIHWVALPVTASGRQFYRVRFRP